jgi:hypothetical protein
VDFDLILIRKALHVKSKRPISNKIINAISDALLRGKKYFFVVNKFCYLHHQTQINNITQQINHQIQTKIHKPKIIKTQK